MKTFHGYKEKEISESLMRFVFEAGDAYLFVLDCGERERIELKDLQHNWYSMFQERAV